MKNAFYLILKAALVLKIFTFFSWLFGHVEKMAWLEDRLILKNYDVTTWLTNNCNTHITQYLEKGRQQDNKIWSINDKTREIFFFRNHAENKAARLG